MWGWVTNEKIPFPICLCLGWSQVIKQWELPVLDQPSTSLQRWCAGAFLHPNEPLQELREKWGLWWGAATAMNQIKGFGRGGVVVCLLLRQGRKVLWAGCCWLSWYLPWKEGSSPKAWKNIYCGFSVFLKIMGLGSESIHWSAFLPFSGGFTGELPSSVITAVWKAVWK